MVMSEKQWGVQMVVGFLMLLIAGGVASEDHGDISGRWRVEDSAVGEGVPEYLAITKSKDGKRKFWIGFSMEAGCIPSIEIKSGQSLGAAYNKKSGRVDGRAVFTFLSAKRIQFPAYPSNPTIYSLMADRKAIDALVATFKHEEAFNLSILSKDGELIYELAFSLDHAFAAVENARNRCESRLLEETDFVIPDSDKRALQKVQLVNLSPRMLNIARNEIFARHGYVFDSKVLAKHFGNKKWYRPTAKSVVLSPVERANVNLLLESMPALHEDD